MIDPFLRALPKVELHVHLVGSASVPTVRALAARHAGGPVPSDPEELAEFYRFRDFAHFLEVYADVTALVRTVDDIQVLVTGLARDLAASTVRYAEVTVTPISHVRAGIDPAALAEALTAGRARASAEHGVELGWIFDTAGEFGVDFAWDTLAWVLRYRPVGTVGFGLGGPELGVGRPVRPAVHGSPGGRPAKLAARRGDHRTGDHLVRPARPRGGQDRTRYPRGHRSASAGPSRGAPHPAGGVPDVQRANRRGAIDGRAPVAAPLPVGRARDAEHRRSRDVRLRPG